MILQALIEHYEDLLRMGKADRFGWSASKISYALYLNKEGELLELVSLLNEEPRGKKTVMVPQLMSLPTPVKRGTNILPNFMWDNSTYIFGVDAKGKPLRSIDCFRHNKKFHERLLAGVDSQAARAVLAYFRNWDPEEAAEHSALKPIWDTVISGVNFCFIVEDELAHEDPAIQDAWQSYYEDDAGEQKAICLATGEYEAVARLHPAIKGVPGGQSTGTSLVSFNASAFCSYGKEQGYNAPTSRYAAFAYGVALNHLVSDWEHNTRLGDTLILSWAAGSDPTYQDAFSDCIQGREEDDNTLSQMIRDLVAGRSVTYKDTTLDPARSFYILGITPYAGRLAVKFFYHNSFGRMLNGMEAHQRRLEIVAPAFDKRETIPLWHLLQETVNQKSRDKVPQTELANRMTNAILTDTRYPTTIINAITLRIRADGEVNRTRAAMIKAYYLKNTHKDVPEEVLTVSLNTESTNIPYNLGRLFSVLEDIQCKALPGLKTTIKDRYFNAASATPSRVFPVLTNLTQKHLRKMGEGTKIYYSKQLQEIYDRLGDEYPTLLSLPQQGSFQLGYYHQTQQRYIPRKTNPDEE